MRGETREGLANIISIYDNIHDHLSNQIAANLELVNFIHDLVVHTCGCANTFVWVHAQPRVQAYSTAKYRWS